MAEEEKSTKSKRRRPAADERSERGGDGQRRSRGSRVTGRQIAELARRELAEITGLEAESATSLERSDDGGWTVTVELLELSRIPETDDMLGLYEVDLDEEGQLLSYRRVRRYSRSQAGESEGFNGS